MTHKFKAGDKVIRIATSSHLVKGNTYTISRPYHYGGQHWIHIEGVEDKQCRFLAEFFELAPDSFTPIVVPTVTRDMTLSVKDDIAHITCGCFSGTLEEAHNEAERKCREDYLHAIRLLDEIATAHNLDKVKPTPKLGEVWQQRGRNTSVVVRNYGQEKKLRWFNLEECTTYEPFDIDTLVGWERVAANIEEYYSQLIS